MNFRLNAKNVTSLKDGDETLVKVQSGIVPRFVRALIYNQDESLYWEGPMTDELVAKADNRLKFFCKAKIVKGKVVLGDDVPDEGW